MVCCISLFVGLNLGGDVVFISQLNTFMNRKIKSLSTSANTWAENSLR